MLFLAVITWFLKLGSGAWAVFAIALILARWALYKWKELKSLPPGPWGIPIFGYLAFMKSGAKHSEYLSLAAKYGPLFSAQLGNQLTVVLSDYKVIRDAFRREELHSRPDTPFMRTLEGFGELSIQLYDLSKSRASSESGSTRLLSSASIARTRENSYIHFPKATRARSTLLINYSINQQV